MRSIGGSLELAAPYLKGERVIFSTFRHADFRESWRVAVGAMVEKRLEKLLEETDCKWKFIPTIYENNARNVGFAYGIDLQPWLPFRRVRSFPVSLFPWWQRREPEGTNGFLHDYFEWVSQTCEELRSTFLGALDREIQCIKECIAAVTDPALSSHSHTCGEVVGLFSHLLLEKSCGFSLLKPVSYGSSSVNRFLLKFSLELLNGPCSEFFDLLAKCGSGKGVGWCFVQSLTPNFIDVISFDAGRFCKKRLSCPHGRQLSGQKKTVSPEELCESLLASVDSEIPTMLCVGYFSDILRVLAYPEVFIAHLGNDRGGTRKAAEALGKVDADGLQLIAGKRESFEPVEVRSSPPLSILDYYLVRDRAMLTNAVYSAANSVPILQPILKLTRHLQIPDCSAGQRFPHPQGKFR